MNPAPARDAAATPFAAGGLSIEAPRLRTVAASPAAAEMDEELEACLRALGRDQDDPTLNAVVGRAYFERGQSELALAFFSRASELDPAAAEAAHNLGVAALACGLDVDAERAFARATELDPGIADAVVNRVTLLTRLGHAEAALDAGTRALARHGRDARLWTSLSAALVELEQPEAEAAAREAVRLDRTQDRAWLNLGNVLYRRRETTAAIDAFRRGLAAAPAAADLHTALGLALLQDGDLAEGFRHYESRLALPNHRASHPYPAGIPVWQGEPLTGRTILLLHEQGHGDTLQFVRYARRLARAGASVHACVPRALLRIVASVEGMGRVGESFDALPQTDYCCSIMSLPQRFGTTLANVDADIPYLSPDPADVARFAPLVAARAAEGTVRVGVVWAGDPRPHDREACRVDMRRSVPASALLPLLLRPEVTVFSLQKGSAAAQGAAWPELVDLMDDVGDFADTAALIAHLDLVVSVDTSVAHLAAAMGKPTWLLSRHDGCWRWLGGRDDSPWYPTLRLFRQDAPGDWQDPLARLAAALERQTADVSGGGDTQIFIPFS